MSKMLKVNDQVYDQLDKLRNGRQTFSDAISELLAARLKIFELISVMEGMMKFREWQRDRIAELTKR